MITLSGHEVCWKEIKNIPSAFMDTEGERGHMHFFNAVLFYAALLSVILRLLNNYSLTNS